MATRKPCSEQVNSWFMRPGIFGYIIDCYAGVEPTPGNNHPRRVFRWTEENGEQFAGNAEAFLIHLGLKFGLELKPSNACMVHSMLRELGEEVLPSKKDRRKPRPDGPTAGRFKQPDPDKRRVRKAKV